MNARRASICRACNNPINIGDRIETNRDGIWAHIQCPPRVAPPAQSAPATPARVAVEDAGVYVLPDGTVAKVQANRDKTRTYAKRWTHKGGARITESEIDRILSGESRDVVLRGKDLPHGDYEFEAGLVQRVAAEGRKMSLAEAKRFIVVYGKCARCSLTLKAAKSVERGIGPKCIKWFPKGTTGADVATGVDAAATANRKRKYEEIFGDDDAAADREIERQMSAEPLPRTYPEDDEYALDVFVDDTEEPAHFEPPIQPRLPAGTKRARRAGRVSRWSRHGDDELSYPPADY